MSWVIR